MTATFDVATLASLHDRALLVPFTGSGMSMGPCVSWSVFVARLEALAHIAPASAPDANLIARGAAAMQRLRCVGHDVAGAIREAVYQVDRASANTHGEALARLHWPLICTTNYDDVYLRARWRDGLARVPPPAEADARTRERLLEAAHGHLPQVLGRSADDCRRVLQQLTLQAGEVVWALQGFLSPAEPALQGCVGADPSALQEELVVGHDEYRRAAHRAPHFRRCFAEVFRQCSLLFLGSGLGESYFLSLFDEIIELSGPPPRPHFALVEEGALDPEFMLAHYHIVCQTYPKGEHDRVSGMLGDLRQHTLRERTRMHSWGWRLGSGARVTDHDHTPDFEVRRAGLPNGMQVGTTPQHVVSAPGEVIAISCGRDPNTDLEADSEKVVRGVPWPGHKTRRRMPPGTQSRYHWLDDWTVQWDGYERAFGIVARNLYPATPVAGEAPHSRDMRSPEAVRRAFLAFLQRADRDGIRVAHVQLLAAGRSRVFPPWVSLTQMARAYGQWRKEQPADAAPLRVIVYVVAPDVIAVLTSGQVDLGEHLEDLPLRFSIQVIDAFGHSRLCHQVATASTPLRALRIPGTRPDDDPLVHAVPTPTRRADPVRLASLGEVDLRDFGLVSGSTLVVDHRGTN